MSGSSSSSHATDFDLIGRTYGFNRRDEVEEDPNVVEAIPDEVSIHSEQSEAVLNPYPQEPVNPEPNLVPDPIPVPENLAGNSQSSLSTISISTNSSSVAMVLKTIVVGGVSIEYDPAGTTTPDSEAFYKKTERAAMKPDKLADLFEKATRTKLTVKFDTVSSTFSDEDKLDDTYNLGILINRFKSHLQKYDMLDVMTIICLDATDSSKPTGDSFDLLVDYSKIPEEAVAASCKWYYKYPKEPYYRQNLQLTADFLENNCSEGLWEKCIEAHDEYSSEERGGPLIFSIMMRLLQSQSDSAVQYLINSVKNLQIRNFEGENVSKVVSLVRGAYKRLKSITKLPEEFPQWVLQLLQTSTVPAFNEGFSHLQRNIEVVDMLMNNTLVPTYPSIENMLAVAQRRYLEMISTNQWSGLTRKANQSAFVGAPPGIVRKVSCWNCGADGHTIKDCTKPLNQASIEQRKKAFRDAKGTGNGKKGDGNKGTKRAPQKWSPPTADERNRRVINGKPMFYVTKTSRWEPDKKAAGNAPAGHVAAPPAVPPAPLPSSDAASKAAMELAVSNINHSVNMAMQGYLNQMA